MKRIDSQKRNGMRSKYIKKLDLNIKTSQQKLKNREDEKRANATEKERKKGVYMYPIRQQKKEHFYLGQIDNP